ncbi:DsrE family protein [Sphingobacterium luzhongxinii]|uniref:DsrE family protein n=1 Tax=Sphingobacterium luzhongxinii TaxID=2654181 RepID=UPI0013DD7119|nr:DsrE family protein [Sphingobacterium sp. xlx-73]
MKNIIITCLFLFAVALQTQTFAQENHLLTKNKSFQGAIAKKKSYKAIYQLDSDDPKIIAKALRNIINALKDPRLQGRLEIELIAFSGGTEAFKKSNSQYEAALKDLIEKGVHVVQCLNTLEERKIAKSELYDFLAFVPSGNGELILRASEGWIIIKP